MHSADRYGQRPGRESNSDADTGNHADAGNHACAYADIDTRTYAITVSDSGTVDDTVSRPFAIANANPFSHAIAGARISE